MNRAIRIGLALVLIADLPGSASAAHTHAGMESQQAACPGTGLDCATAATPYVDAAGHLWLAWTANGSVMLARSGAGGAGFGTAVEVSRAGPLLDTGADARPALVVFPGGRVLVAWGAFKDGSWNAQVWVASSEDGVHFGAPHPLSADTASQRFPALALAADGSLIAAWLDKRTVAANRQRGFRQSSAALAVARSVDGGRSFGIERIVQDRTCECCRPALAAAADGRAVIAFRNVFDDRERDHALVIVDRSGAVRAAHRIAEDHWGVDVCPHHGPAVAIDADGRIHVAWFTQGAARQGTFYARSMDDGVTFTPPLAAGRNDRMAGRPSLLATGRDVWLAWKEFDGSRSSVWLRHSRDGGEHWSEDHQVASAGGYTDHPLLVSLHGTAHLSWLTRERGYQLRPLEEP